MGALSPTGRFDGFGLVSAFDVDGAADYWGMTAGLEQQVGSSVFKVEYTLSRADDNLVHAGHSFPVDQLSPFPDSLNGSDWMDGVSDTDRRHRLVVAMDVPLPGVSQIRFGAVYRHLSGRPFTPGFGYGVDINGDGSFANDPAYVDTDIDGTQALFSAWPCLGQSNGDFAPRNSCRESALNTLDLRLSAALLRIGGSPLTVTAEVMDILQAERRAVDRGTVPD